MVQTIQNGPMVKKLFSSSISLQELRKDSILNKSYWHQPGQWKNQGLKE
jgi:hypothetical protein